MVFIGFYLYALNIYLFDLNWRDEIETRWAYGTIPFETSTGSSNPRSFKLCEKLIGKAGSYFFEDYERNM